MKFRWMNEGSGVNLEFSADDETTFKAEALKSLNEFRDKTAVFKDGHTTWPTIKLQLCLPNGLWRQPRIITVSYDMEYMPAVFRIPSKGGKYAEGYLQDEDIIAESYSSWWHESGQYYKSVQELMDKVFKNKDAK